MEVILREDIDKLGRRGEVVKVADGYGRNFLLPRGLALPVTDDNRSAVERERKAHAAVMAREKAEVELLAERLNGMRYIAPRKVGEHDLLYGSVTAGDIADFLHGKGIEVDKRKIQLEEPIKRLGDYEVKIKLHPEVTATVKVLVTKEG
jgi:large subunit ribosomal protein L9